MTIKTSVYCKQCTPTYACSYFPDCTLDSRPTNRLRLNLREPGQLRELVELRELQEWVEACELQ